MIEGLQPYSEYKESGLPWAGKLPSHWSIKRGKALFSESQLPVRTEDEIVTCFRDGQVTLRRNRRTSGFMLALYETGYQGVRKGHLVIHAMDAFAGAIGVSDSDGKCTPEYIVADPRSDIAKPRYFAKLLRLAAHQGFILVNCPAVRERAPRFRYAHFGDMLMPLPPPDEQAAIVRFLEHANRKIDGFIRAKRKLIGLLNEQKQAIIHRAVTRGLDPHAPLKPSGIPWLGDIPEHWVVRRIKNVGKTKIGLTYSPADVTSENGCLVLRASNIKNSKLIHADDVFVRKEIPPQVRVKTGDILICARSGSRNLVGKSALITSDFDGVAFGAFMSVFRSPWNDFVFWVLNSNLFNFVMAQFETSTINQLTQGDLNTLVIPFPPREEQLEIVKSVEQRTSSLNTAIARTEREIALMQEYRTRLTADVVTGKLDVREAAAKLPAVETAAVGNSLAEDLEEESDPEEDEP